MMILLLVMVILYGINLTQKCSTCEQISKIVIVQVEEGWSETKIIEDFINFQCAQMGMRSPTCYMIIGQHLEQIISEIKKGDKSSEEICRQIKLCEQTK